MTSDLDEQLYCNYTCGNNEVGDANLENTISCKSTEPIKYFLGVRRDGSVLLTKKNIK